MKIFRVIVDHVVYPVFPEIRVNPAPLAYTVLTASMATQAFKVMIAAVSGNIYLCSTKELLATYEVLQFPTRAQETTD